MHLWGGSFGGHPFFVFFTAQKNWKVAEGEGRFFSLEDVALTERKG